MYKSFKNGRLRIALHIFPATAKKVSDVYSTGFNKWDDSEAKNYSIVIARIRVIISIDKPAHCCGET